MTRILNEGLDYHDLEGQMVPEITVDEYKAKMGKDSDIVTLAFTVKSEAAGEDLVNWFERGYDFVLDANVSEGEVSPGKYLVFVELKRRIAVPERICELIEDLETLTALPLKDWTITVDGDDYDADPEVLKQCITISPHQYREKFEKEDEDINEMRQRAGLDTKKNLPEQDAEIKSFKSMAGL
jgi:hypothetical protein